MCRHHLRPTTSLQDHLHPIRAMTQFVLWPQKAAGGISGGIGHLPASWTLAFISCLSLKSHFGG